MENILHDFNKKVISLVTNYLMNSIADGGLSNFTDDLVKEFAELGSKTAEFIINYAEEIIFKLKERKMDFESLEKDNRTIITIFGEVNFRRRYYQDKETKEKIYLLDQFLQLEPNQRMLVNVRERLIKEAIESSYKKAGETAAYGIEISKETVMHEIESLDLETEIIETKIENKKQVKTLYVIADEDHVHLQKGGIEEPRVVIVYDNIISKGNRIELKNKRHFGGIYTKKIDDLWEEVMTYIENSYDTDYLERIYLSGDGANWIKTGKEWLIKSVYVLDEFHMKKAVNGIVGRITKTNKKEKELQKKELRTYLRRLDFVKFKEKCYEILEEEMEKSTRKRKEDLMNYILNNAEGIRNLYKNEKALHGCSAEGHVSHIYSDRMSSRPMGWKKENVNNMSKLRLLREDKIEVKEILQKQGKVVEFKEIKKVRNQANKKIKESINFKPVSIPVMKFGTNEEKIFFKNLLDYKAV
jgi:hypothetical protein